MYARNPFLTPRNYDTGSNLADTGRTQCTTTGARWSTPKPTLLIGGEATPKFCGVSAAMLPGKGLGTSPVAFGAPLGHAVCPYVVYRSQGGPLPARR
ncbi:hypothetical protein ABT072_44800 [Streptomyces sp. NPDC002589]|uniref:hypothetical protein n=1 Tax=Streptomyces sp. NPDC002589 TaxID=3154420 RepID=UPI00332B1B99